MLFVDFSANNTSILLRRAYQQGEANNIDKMPWILPQSHHSASRQHSVQVTGETIKKIASESTASTPVQSCLGTIVLEPEQFVCL